MRAPLGLILALLAGCLPDAGPAARLPPRTGNAWVDCYRRFQPSDDPDADLQRLAAACAAPAGMRAITPVHAGDPQDAHDPPERFAFRARGGRCYRAFAVGGPGVADLDLVVYDPAGRPAAADLSRDRFPVVPPRGPACVEEDGVYTIAVAVTRGSGPYVLQIWGADGAEP